MKLYAGGRLERVNACAGASGGGRERAVGASDTANERDDTLWGHSDPGLGGVRRLTGDSIQLTSSSTGGGDPCPSPLSTRRRHCAAASPRDPITTSIFAQNWEKIIVMACQS